MERKEFVAPYEVMGYQVFGSFSFDKIKEFILQNVRPKSALNITFLTIAILLFAFVGGLLGIGISQFFRDSSAIDWASIGWGIGCTLVGGAILIPTHEAIHGIAYRREGAADVRFGVNWKSFVFYAAAHNFAVDYRAYRRVALAPLILLLAVLLLLLLALLSFSTPLWSIISVVVILLFHLLTCSGDLMMIAYMARYKHHDVITVDDVDNRYTYFMERTR